MRKSCYLLLFHIEDHGYDSIGVFCHLLAQSCPYYLYIILCLFFQQYFTAFHSLRNQWFGLCLLCTYIIITFSSSFDFNKVKWFYFWKNQRFRILILFSVNGEDVVVVVDVITCSLLFASKMQRLLSNMNLCSIISISFMFLLFWSYDPASSFLTFCLEK